ncbi:MAG: tRNA pseudouridine(55) synthase TruB [Alphaproteobacteria bacterium]|nr:tRNA pseudouridine(55) synthase TruB [Alphaproteobacteria bacterium]
MMRKKKGLKLDGWLIIDKPPGLTSAHVVAKVKRMTQAAKIGHAGTLDPLATGILPLALGEATKTVSYAMDGAKTYRFTVRWGEGRDSDDSEGAVTQTSDARPDRAAIEAALPGFRGDIMQVPPVYSALKVDGERAYDLARRGEAPVLEARPIRIDRFDLIDMPDADHAVFEVDCGKGSYIRALARDLGAVLGCYGHIVALRRTRVGPFREEQAFSLEKLGELWENPPSSDTLLPVETALDDIPALAVTGPQADRLRSGQEIRVIHRDDGISRVMNAGTLVALAEIEDGCVRPVRVFNL